MTIRKMQLVLIALFFAGCSSQYTLTVQVRDENGTPMPGARVWGWKIWLTGWDDHSQRVEALTDASGTATIKTPRSLDLEVQAPGYYTKELPFLTGNVEDIPAALNRRGIPDEPLIVELYPEDPQVEVLEDKASLFTMHREIPARIERGLVFTRMDAKVVDDWREASVWFRFHLVGERDAMAKPVTEYNARQWEVIVQGANGWEIMKEPEELKESPSRLAPESGYIKELQFRGDQFPSAIYLRLNDGERYGKLFDFTFVDDPRELGRVQFSCEYIVQTNSTGNRSLNPKKRPMFSNSN